MTNRRKARPAALTLPAAAVAVLSTVLLTGCSSQQSAPELPAKNQSQWVMPLDQYQDPNAKAGTYAELLLDQPCMEDAGIDWPVPYLDTTRANATTNSIGRRIFNEKVASVWGYHYGGNSGQSTPAWTAFKAYTNSLSEANFRTLRACQVKSRRIVPNIDNEHNYASDLVAQAITTAEQASTVQAAAGKWRSCMATAGVPDLPITPFDMPTPSLHDRFQLDSNKLVSPEEKAAAEHDYSCRRTSGYEKASYEAEWEAQVKLLGDNQATLDANKQKIDAASKKVAAVIAENAPTS